MFSLSSMSYIMLRIDQPVPITLSSALR